ncbi:aspartate aminotransferase [Candidatus Woesearchaeota archaeon CG_4_10_14_0_8_um_filter_47_5]|nr:MAG: aspartate aminotransferase [Candidatus Woesearchaeota archaeon CG_4_10_14_0_8_um_filter_47_5]
MKIAQRMSRLGTETAFAVGAEAAELKKQGRIIYPFHLGDMNIRTPENIIAAAHKAMQEKKTGYAPTAGIPELRKTLAEAIGKTRGLPLTFENVSVQPGGKPVIGKFIQVLMGEGDEVLYPNPGYPIYESMINYYGGVAIPYNYEETDEGFVLDLKKIERCVTPRTRLFIYNNYHNPLGAASSKKEMEALAGLCKKHNLWVLSDEAYFDILYEGKGESIASLPGMSGRTVILYTFSKKFAMTGWRLGAAIGPKPVIDQINRLNVNDESCTNHFVQCAGVEALKGPQDETRKILAVLKGRRDLAVELLNTIKGVKVHKPKSTFYLFANVTGAMKAMKLDDVEEFRKLILHKTGVSFCTRKHFGTPLPGETEHYIRLAYSGIGKDAIREGLTAMKQFIESR